MSTTDSAAKPSTALSPDFEATRDKCMSELTPAQQDDAKELWLRNNLGFMPEYHREFYTFLLSRMDAARAEHAQLMSKQSSVATGAAVPQGADVVVIDGAIWDDFAKDYKRYESGDLKMPFSQLRQSLGSVIEDANRHHAVAASPAAAAPETRSAPVVRRLVSRRP